MSMARISINLHQIYYATVYWTIIDSMYTHFSELLVMDDFISTAMCIIYPRVGLRNFAMNKGMHQEIRYLTFLPEWGLRWLLLWHGMLRHLLLLHIRVVAMSCMVAHNRVAGEAEAEEATVATADNSEIIRVVTTTMRT